MLTNMTPLYRKFKVIQLPPLHTILLRINSFIFIHCSQMWWPTFKILEMTKKVVTIVAAKNKVKGVSYTTYLLN